MQHTTQRTHHYGGEALQVLLQTQLGAHTATRDNEPISWDHAVGRSDLCTAHIHKCVGVGVGVHALTSSTHLVIGIRIEALRWLDWLLPEHSAGLLLCRLCSEVIIDPSTATACRLTHLPWSKMAIEPAYSTTCGQTNTCMPTIRMICTNTMTG